MRGHPHPGAVGLVGDGGELGVEYCWAPGAVEWDITPPEADTLISLAPCRTW
jgi:hypothetical protein